MKWLVYGFIVALIAFNWNPVFDLNWWQWYLLIGLLNYIHFAFVHRIWRIQGGFLEELVEWAFFVFLWPAQLAFFLFVSVHSASGWLLERIWR